MFPLTLHVLTAVTRPENLLLLGGSLISAHRADMRIVWHWQFDHERQHVGGQALKNAMLDTISDGWVWILDDDNLAHPDFCATVMQLLAQHPDAAMLVLSQELPGGGVRVASPDALRVDGVDAAQVVIRREALGARRLPETYAGDGLLIAELAATFAPEQIVYGRGEPATYYNRLQW